MMYDVITYNGEWELFEIRYNVLKDYVDEFIVIEFDKTFSGKEKPWHAERKDIWYDPLHTWPKVKYCKVTEDIYSKYKELAEASPNTVGADHWKMEFMQKESIKDCLTHLNDDDIVFIGDCDEIWNYEQLRYFTTAYEPEKLKLQVFTYFLNNSSDEEFWGTLIGRYEWVKESCLNHLRTNSKKSVFKYGWHFTSMYPHLRQKLEDSYTKETYANDAVMNNLEENVQNNKDFLGRGFTYTTDESLWPEWLKNNKEKFAHLLK